MNQNLATIELAQEYDCLNSSVLSIDLKSSSVGARRVLADSSFHAAVSGFTANNKGRGLRVLTSGHKHVVLVQRKGVHDGVVAG